MNTATLIGRIGKELELKTLPSGNSVLNFTMATDESYKKDGQKVEVTNWHNIVVFGKQAEAVSRLTGKGKRVAVTGKISNRMWEKDGEKKYITEITANNVEVIDFNEKGEASNSAPVVDSGFASSDIPF